MLDPDAPRLPDMKLFEPLTATMVLLLVSIAGLIFRFSRRYLAGEVGQARFTRWFSVTVAAALLLVVTNNLLVLALSWTASTLALHQLLTFYADRPAALIAAHKKFLLSRVADVAIFSAVALIWTSLGTVQITEVVTRAAALSTVPGTLQLAGLLLVLGVALRSAQLPFHGWLIQVMEAPTPISALLHAGIVNIGGFVLIRLAPMMVRLEAAQTALVVIGTMTAVLAALVMSTRVSIKVQLAWSTCAQMGFMLLECGLGAYSLALLHLVAHSIYKAHAFLSSGRAVERQPARAIVQRGGTPGLARWASATLVSALLVVGAATALGVQPGTDIGLWAAAVILTVALSPLFVRATAGGDLRIATAVMTGLGVVLLYLTGHALFDTLLPAATPTAPSIDGMNALRLGIVVGGFLLLYAVQVMIASRPHGAVARRLYPACFAGFYLDEVFTRLTFALWPPRPAPASLPSLPTTAASLAMPEFAA